MTELTTTVKIDRTDPPDYVYETDVTSKVLDARIKAGRSNDASTARIGTCSFKLNNADGAYTPAAGGSAIRPLQPVQVTVESQNLFTGFVRRAFLDPSGDQKVMTMDCADALWVLSRKDISRPLMRDVRSDILAHRIVDAAEVGELIKNDHFRDDSDDDGLPDDWVEASAANVTTDLVTDAPTFEQPNVLAVTVTTTAVDRGVLQTDNANSVGPDDIDVRGNTVCLAAYVRADSASDVGETVEALIFETGAGAGTTRSGTVTLTEQWQRVEVERAINAAAVVILFYIVAPSGETTAFTFRVGAAHAVMKQGAIPRDFDDGQSVFAYVAPRRMTALSALREVANNELGGYIYVNGAGTLMFEDKAHRWRETASTVSQGTVDETMVAMPYEENADDIIGEVELGYMKWEVGEPGTPVWGLYPVPRAIPANDTLTIDIDYGAIVRDTITPVANTDYEISDGAGNDLSGSVTLAFEDYGGGARAVFTSSVAYTTFLDSLQVRATPVRPSSDAAQVTYTPSGAPAVASKLRYSYRLQSSKPFTQAYAEYLGNRYVTQRSRLPPVLVNKSGALVTQMTERVISDRVTLVNDDAAYSAKVDGDFYIDSIEHRLDMGKTWMETRWGCVPVDNHYWKLGTGKLGDSTGTDNTRLGG